MNAAVAAEILLEAQHAQRALYTFTVSIKKKSMNFLLFIEYLL